MRRLHFAVTILLALALAVVGIVSARSHRDLQERLQSKVQENAALKKRAETAEANTHLVIDRFAEVMKGLANEAGRFSGRSLAKHEKSFVQAYSFYSKRGKEMATAGTACYLGGRYFLTAKHVVVQEAEPGQPPPKTTRIQVRINGQLTTAELVDKGEAPEPGQVDIDDWAVLSIAKDPEGLVPVVARPGYSFMFGERLVRYGNDSNRGIMLAAGYVAQVSEDGWVSWLVDSLPGCSGGGVVNDKDQLVGLNGGYLDGNTRLAVIIPIRREMFRSVPGDLALALDGQSPPSRRPAR